MSPLGPTSPWGPCVERKYSVLIYDVIILLIPLIESFYQMNTNILISRYETNVSRITVLFTQGIM